MDLNIIHQAPETKKYNRPLVFVHGMWQGSWVWEEHFLPYFISKGFECYALNLRGHNGSQKKGPFPLITIGSYVDDLKQLIDTLEVKPIVIAHSMGGFIVQKYLEKSDLPMAILLAPVPPRGLWKPTFRVMFKMPLRFLWGNLTLSMWPIINSVERSRLMFFGPDMSDERIQHYLDRMQNESYVAYLGMLMFSLVKPKKVSSTTKIELIGASDDWAIPTALIHKSAKAYGIEPKFFEGNHHNLMLEDNWEEVAEYCLQRIIDLN